MPPSIVHLLKTLAGLRGASERGAGIGGGAYATGFHNRSLSHSDFGATNVEVERWSLEGGNRKLSSGLVLGACKYVVSTGWDELVQKRQEKRPISALF